MINFKKIKIENFKSIKNKIELDLTKNFFGFIGFNGVGKSNILNAINFINDTKNIDSLSYEKYCNRDFFSETNNNKEVKVEYYFSYTPFVGSKSSVTSDQIFELFSEKIIINIINKNPKFAPNLPFKQPPKIDSELFNSFIEDNNIFGPFNFKYSICLNKDNKINKKLELLDYFSGPEFNVKFSKLLQKYPTTGYVRTLQTYEENFKIDISFKSLLNELILSFSNEIISLLNNSVFLWKYSEKNMLNDETDLTVFLKNKENFSILNNIISYFSKCSKIDFFMLLQQINSRNNIPIIRSFSNKMSKLFNDFLEKTEWDIITNSKIKFSFEVTKDKIGIYIESKNGEEIYSKISEESDGYKQFLSFVFSVPLDEKMENKIILLDEPEIHLHPSSVVSMRKLLIRLSEKNKVIFSTHSPNMIDKQKMDSYILTSLSVEKQLNTTNLINFLETDINQYPSILKEAFGLTIIEDYITPEFLIFVEGGIDSNILSNLASNFTTSGCQFIPCYGANIKNLPKIICSFLPKEYVKNHCYIICDNDSDGKKFLNFIKENNNALFDEQKIVLLSEIFSSDSKNQISTIESIYDYEDFNNFSNNIKNLKSKNDNQEKKQLIQKNKEEFCKKFVNSNSENKKNRIKEFSNFLGK